jgi:hypothetical protein
MQHCTTPCSRTRLHLRIHDLSPSYAAVAYPSPKTLDGVHRANVMPVQAYSSPCFPGRDLHIDATRSSQSRDEDWGQSITFLVKVIPIPQVDIM